MSTKSMNLKEIPLFFAQEKDSKNEQAYEATWTHNRQQHKSVAW